MVICKTAERTYLVSAQAGNSSYASGWFGPGAGRLIRVALVALPLALGACVSTGPQDGASMEIGPLGLPVPSEPNDPFENVNRAIFAFNLTVDRFLFRPIAISYTELTPEPIRESVTTLLRNLRLPLSALHALLQGKVGEAGTTVARFVTNGVTLWLGDLSKDMSYPDEDAGQTLAVAGIADGPYLVLPLLGPANVRDAFGRLIDSIVDPVGIAIGPTAGLTRTVVGGVDRRARFGEQLENLEESSLDFYATVRSLYTQNRESEIRDGDVDPFIGAAPTVIVEFGIDFRDDFGSDFVGRDFVGDFSTGVPGDGEMPSVDETQGGVHEDTEVVVGLAPTPAQAGGINSTDEQTSDEKKPISAISELKKTGIDVDLFSSGVAVEVGTN